jgi:hypothetical protein
LRACKTISVSNVSTLSNEEEARPEHRKFPNTLLGFWVGKVAFVFYLHRMEARVSLFVSRQDLAVSISRKKTEDYIVYDHLKTETAVSESDRDSEGQKK